jgi:hypothetical protein
VQAEIGGHCVSANRSWRAQRFHAHRNREVRSSDLIGAVGFGGTGGPNPKTSEFRHSEFPVAGNLESRTREPRNPDVTWQRGTLKLVGDACKRIGTSVFGLSKGKYLTAFIC